jgi:hypothetical protein
MKLTRLIRIVAFASPLLAQHLNEPKMLLPGNAYNPIPSPDGKYIAYVGTGWAQGRHADDLYMAGTGRASLVSDVEFIDSSGHVLDPLPGRYKFLEGWTADSKAAVCYRDGRYVILTPSGQVLESGDIPQTDSPFVYERVAFLPDDHIVWLQRDPDSKFRGALFRDPNGARVHLDRGGDKTVIAPSPNGRYLAFWDPPDHTIRVLDRLTGKTAGLGEAAASPDKDWDYIQPSWDPWFPDSEHLVFFSWGNLVVSTPDGKDQRVLLVLGRPAGLAVASPDGQSIAYVTFKSRPMTRRRDLKFWGDSAVWVFSLADSRPRQITAEDQATTSGLRWLGNDSVVFDRIDENIFSMHARIWKVSVR